MTSSAPPPEPSSRLATSAGVIGLATLASRLLGLVREQVFAFFFGASAAADAFLIAFRIPNLLRDLFAEGAMSAAFVPTFTRSLTHHGRDGAWRLGNNVVTSLIVVTGGLVALGIVFSEPLVRLYAEDYGQVPGKLELTIQLTRVMLPFLTLVAVAAAFMGMLNALNRYFVPALSPAMFNVGMILCMVALVPVMPRVGLPAVAAVAIGTLIGGCGQVLVQWPTLRRAGYRYRVVLDLTDPDFRRVVALMGPSVVGLAAVQVNLFVNSVLATGEAGAVAWLSYAFRLMYLPIGLFGVSVATAAIPEMSRHVAVDDTPALRAEFSRGLRLMLALNVPATLGLVALATPIVALIFERGSFLPADTTATALALTFYAPGLVGYSVVKLATPVFYARQESRTPVVVSVLTMVLNVVLNLALVRVMGYRGLALGTAVAALFNAGTLLVRLRPAIGGLGGRELATSFAKILAASTVMAGAAWFVHQAAATYVPGTGTPFRLLHVGSAIATGIVVLMASARLLDIPELEQGRALILARLRGRRR